VRRLRIRRPLLALILLIALLAAGYAVRAVNDTGSAHPRSVMSSVATSSPAGNVVALSSLPAQAAQTVRLIQRGGPFPYPSNDAVVFHNNEHLLPAEPDGYYHEYTVPTPGESTRGARRIITGRDGEYYYTGDHYETFVRVDVTQ
jgi:ribonuclease T1